MTRKRVVDTFHVTDATPRAFCDGRRLTAQQLNNLRLYKYCGVDQSLLSRFVLNPFWNWLVQLVPLSIAPNMLTLIGLLFMASATTLVWLHDDPPRWLFFYIAFSLSAYLNLDAIDGKQARRTGTSGPLGELFDHGCDAINMMFTAILFPTIFALPLAPMHIWIALLGYAGFFGATWEQWHTGVLHLGCISGPVEGAWSICLAAVVSGLFGPAVWSRSAVLLGRVVSAQHVIVALYCAGAIGTLIASMFRVHRKSGASALRQLLPVSLHLAACYGVARALPTILHDRNNYRWFVLFSGIPSCYRVSLTIIGHLTKSPIPGFLWMDVLPVVVIVMSLLGHGTDMPFLHGLLPMQLLVGVVAVFYLCFMRLVIGDLCAHLDINCLTIKRRQ